MRLAPGAGAGDRPELRGADPPGSGAGWHRDRRPEPGKRGRRGDRRRAASARRSLPRAAWPAGGAGLAGATCAVDPGAGRPGLSPRAPHRPALFASALARGGQRPASAAGAGAGPAAVARPGRRDGGRIRGGACGAFSPVAAPGTRCGTRRRNVAARAADRQRAPEAACASVSPGAWRRTARPARALGIVAAAARARAR